MTIEKKTAEQHEIIIEDLNSDIKKLNEFFEYTQETKIDAEVKRDVLNRVNKEIEWLEQIREEEQDALNFDYSYDDDAQRREDFLVDCAIEEEMLERAELKNKKGGE